MKIQVNKHRTIIEKTPVNEKEINVTECEFVFDEEIENDYVKEAVFTKDYKSYKEIIINNKCQIPYEVLNKSGQVEIGVVVYKVNNGEYEKLYNPTPVYFNVLDGSLKDKIENSQEITPSELEQYQQALNDGLVEAENVNINASKSGSVATVTITDRYGVEKEVQISDGQDGKDGEPGPQGQEGPQGPAGRDGQPGANGRDGYKQYQAGENITIENDTISATVPEIDLSNYYTKSQIDGMIGNINNVLATLTTVEEG